MDRPTGIPYFSSSGGSIRLSVICTVLAGVLFACLMAVRLDLFKKPPEPLPFSNVSLENRDAWMTIWQADRKIGYSHRRFLKAETGYKLTDHTVMRINTMGLAQDIQMETSADLNADLSVSTFNVDMTSSRFSFSVQGEVTGSSLQVRAQNKPFEFPLDGPVYIPACMWKTIAKRPMQPGETTDFPFFDPISLGKHPARVTFVGREPVLIFGLDHSARKYEIAFMGTTETAWIDTNGEVLKEESLLGISILKDTRDRALEKTSLSGSRDLTLAASVAAGMTLDEPDKLTRLEMEMEGIPETLTLNDGRQSFSNKILIIAKEPLPDPPAIPIGKEALFLEPAPFIESNHPEIIEAAKEAVGVAARPIEKVRNLTAWVYNTLEKRPVLSVPTALEILREGMGDCNEHATLLVALARAAGIPARVEAGLVYMDGRFYYHAWNSLYLGEWITADAVMNQLPADVTHIRLVRGVSSEQAGILGTVGNISIQILKAE